MSVAVDVASLALSAATALATGITAFVIWRGYRGRFSVEGLVDWVSANDAPAVGGVTVILRNTTRETWRIGHADITGLPVLLFDLPDRRGHGGLAVYQALPMDRSPLEPGGTRTFRFVVEPDWRSWSASLKPRLLSSAYARVYVALHASPANSTSWFKRHATKIIVPIKIISDSAARAGST
jgi:hypothetical protein